MRIFDKSLKKNLDVRYNGIKANALVLYKF